MLSEVSMKIPSRLFFALIAGGVFLVSAYAQSQPVALDPAEKPW
jgi:hypothetical protein